MSRHWYEKVDERSSCQHDGGELDCNLINL